MPITTVIFDLGRVLLEYDISPEVDAVRRLCQDPTLAVDRYVELVRERDMYTGRTGNREAYDALVERAGLGATYERFLETLTCGFGGVVPGMDRIVDSLDGPFRLALLTNTNPAHWQYALLRHGTILDKVRPHFVSYEIGLAKPQPEVFRHVVKQLGAAPDECLFIDDAPVNVRGARSEGLHACQFVDAADLVQQLAELGINL